MIICDNWKLNYFESGQYDIEEIIKDSWDDTDWYNVKVPGDVHSTMLKENVIEDPYYSTNDIKCQWIEKKIWIYRNQFIYEENKEELNKIELTFNGLDTFATIYLNGKEVGCNDNMFVENTIDVTDSIKTGLNTLVVEFHAMCEQAKKYSVREGMWSNYSHERIWVRKSGTTFGWDWGPRIATIGIWREVNLKSIKTANIENVFIKAKQLDFDKYTGQLEFMLDVTQYDESEITTRIIIEDHNGIVYEDEKKYVDNEPLKVNLENIQFWWPYDIGQPYLYKITVLLIHNGKILDRYNTKYGIRDIGVKLLTDNYQSRFTFVVNDVEIFARGANWIPSHNFIGAIKDERYKKLIHMAKEANMNMLRVWGGGIYEKDIFYEICNELGILVWQDFMSACVEHPDYDNRFINTMKVEIEKAVKRLRNYSCIAIWVGNNENQMIQEKLGLKRDLYGKKLFEDIIPGWMKRLDDSRFYWPTSSYGGKDVNGEDFGDKHNWEVWHDEVASYKRYALDRCRFSSEFGLHACPVKETLCRNIPEEELYYGSFEIDYRNKDFNPNKALVLLEGHTGLPENLDEYIDFSMLLQAEGLKYAVEHYRRRFPENSGSLIWQLNDCWPGQSWSMVDYYLFPKASYYYARKFFAPILLSFKEEEENVISIWVINNSLKTYTDELIFGVSDFMGYEAYNETINVSVPGNTSKEIKKIRIDGKFYPNIIVFQRTRWLYAYIKSKNNKAYENIYFFKEHKDVFMPKCYLVCEWDTIENGLLLKIKTNNFARFVKIEYCKDETLFSDNYFDIEPKQEKSITILNYKEKIVKEDFRITALNSN